MSNSFNWKNMFLSDQIETIYHWWLRQVDHEHTTVLFVYLFILHICKGDNSYISSFEKSFNVIIFSNTVKAKSFKLCMIITLLGVYIYIVGLMILILF